MGYGGMLLVSLSSRDASFHPTGTARTTGTRSKAGHGSEDGLCRIRLPAAIPTMIRCLPIPQGAWPHPEWEGSQNPKYSLDYPHKCLNLCVQGQLHSNRAEESPEAEHAARAFLCLHIAASSSSLLPLSLLPCWATGENPSSPGCTKSSC